MGEETVLFLSGLLHAERLRQGTRTGRRALGCFKQVVLILRWFLDGTLIETDRVATPGPTAGVDLWWSGKHHHHGGNVQVVSAPDGWPLWTSHVRPGREHDTTCLRHHGILPVIALAAPDLPTLADLGYEGEAGTVHVPTKKAAHGHLSDDQKTTNLIHAHLRSGPPRLPGMAHCLPGSFNGLGIDQRFSPSWTIDMPPTAPSPRYRRQRHDGVSSWSV
jgi:hypothetical protein